MKVSLSSSVTKGKYSRDTLNFDLMQMSHGLQ